MLYSSKSKGELQVVCQFGKQNWLHFCFVLLSCGVTEVYSSSPPKTLASNSGTPALHISHVLPNFSRCVCYFLGLEIPSVNVND